jgi:lipoprotein-anchoring transpeptidase ErfK/SrfK
VDGVFGSQTRAALIAFQEKVGLPRTGALDGATRQSLILEEPAERPYIIGREDLERIHTVPASWLGRSQMDRLDYESLLELVAEQGRAHPKLIRAMNPAISWTNLLMGTVVTVPNVLFPPVTTKAALIRIRLGGKYLQAFDGSTNLLAHFPCSIARQVEKRPVGMLFVETFALNPNYRFDPAIFPESEEGRALGRPLILPPGPNNPVGTAWIGLSRPGYGIHGTPRPEEVGRTESHGCFRLANWNAEYLAQLVRNGTTVLVEP